MPNIEIHGEIGKDKEELIKDILLVLGMWDKDAIINKIGSKPTSCPVKNSSEKGKPMPYIRVCATDAAEIDKIVKTLKKAHLGVDTEELLLRKFTSAKDMK